jgi:hypothetical protein
MFIPAALLVGVPLVYVLGIARGWFGELEDAGHIVAEPIPAEVRAGWQADQAASSE